MSAFGGKADEIVGKADIRRVALAEGNVMACAPDQRVPHYREADYYRLTGNPSFSRRASGDGSLPRNATYASSGSIDPPEE